MVSCKAWVRITLDTSLLASWKFELLSEQVSYNEAKVSKDLLRTLFVF